MVKRWQLEQESPTDADLEPYVGREIDLLYELPLIHEMITAVYFVFDLCELVYVGSSDGVANRLNYYYRDRNHGRLHWSHIGVMPVPEEIRFTVEAHYIKRFWPRLNKECA
jgi:hypothetical protein